MRLNRIKSLLIPLVCLSLISCNKTDSKDIYNQEIQEEYKLFLSKVNNSLYESSLKSVVSILNIKDGNASSIGSGFIYDQDDKYQYIITNYHVIKGETKHQVISCTGQVKSATVLGYDELFDVALLKTEIFVETSASKFSNADYKLIKNPLVGDEVYAIGNPGSLDNYGTITSGIISGVDRDAFSKSSTFENADFAIQLDVALNPGNSGGPLFDSNGNVIGINTFKLDKIDGITYKGANFALPIQDALLIVDTIRKEGKFTRATIGSNKYISTKDLTLYEKNYLQLDPHYATGVVIKEFGTNNVLNILKHSIITKVNGIEVNSVAELRRQLYFAGPNKKIKISYYENGENGFDFKEKEIEVTTKSLVV